MTRLTHVVVVAIVSIAMTPRVAAQASTPAGVLYRLDADATYQRGCFDPCACPVLEQGSVQGTFRLTPMSPDPLFQYYAVTDINWKVMPPHGAAIPIHGSGTFKIGGEVAIQEQLSLDLVVGTDPVQHFDSGVVVPQVPFPRMDLTVSIHGVFCFDTVIKVRARPSPRLAVERDALAWDPDPPATGFDVVRGNLGALRATGGDYRLATEECLANDLAAESLAYPISPGPGQAWWFLIRTEGGSYDAWDAAPAAPRDAGIDADAASCP
jgi:hypothetical protein